MTHIIITLARRLHLHHCQGRKHVIIAHGMELIGGAMELLKLELLAHGLVMGGVMILIIGLLTASDA